MRTWLIYILAGACLGLGFFLKAHWFFGIIGVFIFLLALEKTTTQRRMVFGSYLTWVTSLAFSVSLFGSVYPIEWIDLGLGKVEVLVVGAQWFITAVVLATGGLVFGFIFWFIRNHLTAKLEFFLFPFLWVMAEISQSFIYSVFVLGEGGSLNVFNSVGYLGYLISDQPLLLQMAKLGGVYALSLSGAGLGYLLWLGFKQLSFRKFIRIGATAFLVLFVIQFVTYKFFPAELKIESDIKVAVVNTNFGGKEFYQAEDQTKYRFEQINEAVQSALKMNVDYIILPEDSRLTLPGISGESAYKKFRFQNGDPDTLVIDTARALGPQGVSFLRAFIYDGVAKKVWEADKQYLTPVGEYLPFSYDKLLRGVGLKAQVDKLNKNLSYRPGPNLSQAEMPDYVPAVLFCFEALNPVSVRSLVAQRQLPFVAHPISHAWFHDSRLLETHLDMMLQIQAIWNHVNIISAGNMVTGKVYTEQGRIVEPEVVAEGDRWRVSLVDL